ncbi:hypothetical protein VM1G_00653 [Cytospora mali]|uniref:Rhodopsin domain-containing protein n=1 Tax=Cytospora mali TaxID=578113 RepID=A0A194VKS2_CYTMA|nr:hypothetical protein VM1G_00653 [Valsa mali]
MLSYTPLPVPPQVKAHLIVNTIVLFITVLVVGLRIVSRSVAGSKLGWDDYLTLLAVPQGVGMLILQGLWSTTGVGYGLSVASKNWPYLYSLLLPFLILFATSTLTAKLSVLCFYFRIFTTRKMRLATKLTMGFVLLWGIGNLLQTILVCHFKNGKWLYILEDYCSEQAASFISMGFFNCITNLIIMFVPLHTVWTLNKVSVSTRLGLSGVFLLSLIVTVVSAVRIAAMIKIVQPEELTRAMAMAIFLTNLEVHLSILCNSLPMLIPLYAYWKHRKFGGAGEDEYVSRLRGSSASRRHQFLVEDLTNGLPLETIYGQNGIHFTATVGRGEPRSPIRARSEDDSWDSESTRRLPWNAQAITIETKWSITEEQAK